MNKEQLKNRTRQFAYRCIKLSAALPKSYLGNHIKGQLIRCSTSVASNYRAACISQSKASFISKLGIVIEEADEVCFWMELVIDEKLINKQKVVSLLGEAKELVAIFISSRKTARKKIVNRK